MSKRTHWQMSENNECYTTTTEAEKMVEYLIEQNAITKNTKIWLPFDTKLSRIYLTLKKKGFVNLIRTSLADGLDFYHYEPSEWEVIISNPPFSDRTRLFERLFAFRKPFVILQGTQMFNNQNVINHLCEYDGEISFLLPRTRMKFMMYDEEQNIIQSKVSGASFYSFWFCFKILRGGGVFLRLLDSGKENEIERMGLDGNVIQEKHIDLFSFIDD